MVNIKERWKAFTHAWYQDPNSRIAPFYNAMHSDLTKAKVLFKKLLPSDQIEALTRKNYFGEPYVQTIIRTGDYKQSNALVFLARI